MIYLLDCEFTENSHSKYILDILSKNTDVNVEHVVIPDDPTYGELFKILLTLFPKVTPKDIVLCPWAVAGDYGLDELFDELCDLCWVVAAAGNFNSDISDFTPARTNKVITVACLNKSGLKAALSNWSDEKELIWLAGTNYDVGWANNSGTSVSAAVYAAFLAESIKNSDPTLLDHLIGEYTKQVWAEINTN